MSTEEAVKVKVIVDSDNVRFDPAIPPIATGRSFEFEVEWRDSSSIESIAFSNFRELIPEGHGYTKSERARFSGERDRFVVERDGTTSDPIRLDPPIDPHKHGRLVSCDLTLSVNGTLVTIDPPLDEKP